MTKFYNRTEEKETRRALRNNMPKAEVLLWIHLKGKQIDGLKFRRQYSVGPYVVDFYCPAAKLAIEVDGDSHFGGGAEARDFQRQAFIESFGIRFIRPTNGDIYHNCKGVVEDIWRVARERKDPPLSPLSKGGMESS